MIAVGQTRKRMLRMSSRKGSGKAISSRMVNGSAKSKEKVSAGCHSSVWILETVVVGAGFPRAVRQGRGNPAPTSKNNTLIPSAWCVSVFRGSHRDWQAETVATAMPVLLTGRAIQGRY